MVDISTLNPTVLVGSQQKLIINQPNNSYPAAGHIAMFDVLCVCAYTSQNSAGGLDFEWILSFPPWDHDLQLMTRLRLKLPSNYQLGAPLPLRSA